ncbi:fungal hydrophobin [Crassisporium funariophilum]|nr:fungal hydrophobin [Crassisporium funariophilum]
MFSHLALLATASMAIFVVAAPAIENSCNTGSVQCCMPLFLRCYLETADFFLTGNSVHEANSDYFQTYLGLVGIVTGPLTGQAGITCTPVTVIGVGSGASCSSQPVCCSDNTYNGVVAMGCSPVNISV